MCGLSRHAAGATSDNPRGMTIAPTLGAPRGGVENPARRCRYPGIEDFAMLNIRRGLPLLLLAILLALPLQATAQDAKKPSKRPPLRARVVTDSRVGVPVVVTGQEPATEGSAAPANPNVQILIEDGAAGPVEPEIENWLVDGPSQPESWLNETVSAPATGPAVVPATDESPQLVGVQHYMESTEAMPTAEPPSTGTRPTTFSLPPRGASTVPVPAAAPTNASARAQPVASGTYLLGPGDEIDVHVWRNPDLSRKVPVRPDGLISLPLAGELMASGKTVAELNAELTAVLGQFVQHPTVTVTVTQVRSMVIYVTGRVARSGTLTLDRPVNVVQAITMAGGVQEFADRNGVVVIRTVNGKQVRIPFRYGDAVKGKGDVADFVLQSGDVVYVP